MEVVVPIIVECGYTGPSGESGGACRRGEAFEGEIHESHVEGRMNANNVRTWVAMEV